MSLSIGIVGLPNVGKSTLFNALTKNDVLAANYPFATIEPNVGIVPLPDKRLSQLAKLYPSATIVPAPVTFVDIAGLVRGASEGAGLGNQFLAHIRQTAALAHIVRTFADTAVSHVDGSPNPERDIQTINMELQLADLQTLERRLVKVQTDSKKGTPHTGSNLQFLTRVHSLLNKGTSVRDIPLTEAERLHLVELQLLTAKPLITVFNLSEQDLANTGLRSELAGLSANTQPVFVCAQVEAQLADLPSAEAAELLHSLGQSESGLAQLSTAGFEALGLQTFLTAGPKEVRAWVINRGATAPEAAGVIHTDFQKGFIKAEVVSCSDLLDAGSISSARALGRSRIEGKDYIMKDGDVVEFRFNL